MHVYPSVPKVLASGLEPQPPPAFDSTSSVRGEFDPPIIFEDPEIADAAEEPAAADAGASGHTPAASTDPVSSATDGPAANPMAAAGKSESAAAQPEAKQQASDASAQPPAGAARRGYRIKKKSIAP